MERRKFLLSIGASSLIGLAGCAGGNDGTDAGNVGCTQEKLNEPGDTVKWEAYSNGVTEIESVDFTISNVKDFPVTGSYQFLFEDEETPYNPTVVTKTVTLEGGETKELTVTRTGLDATRYDVSGSISCPS